MKSTNYFSTLIFVVIFGIGLAIAYSTTEAQADSVKTFTGAASFFVALIIASSIKVADQWEKVVVLRLGRFHVLRGPGLFFIIPIIDTIPYWIDIRVITSSFTAEKTLTKDTVPVDVDAVLFWKVINPKKAALDVADYKSAINWASQTALRDVIGKTMLSDMLEGREKISNQLQKIIDERTEPWGINVISVEVKDVLIPQALEDSMSMQAQAERERQARVILGDSERQIAVKFEEAAKSYANSSIYNEFRWLIDIFDGKNINPDSGKKDDPVPGPVNDYQDKYQAEGLCKSIPWYATIGNHDHFFNGAVPFNDKVRKNLTGNKILHLGNLFADVNALDLNTYSMGTLDGSTVNGDIIGAGEVDTMKYIPTITADPNRRALS